MAKPIKANIEIGNAGDEAGLITTPQPQAHSARIDIATLPNLYAGVTGRTAHIRMLQAQLNKRGYLCAVTGVFDQATAQAVQRLQVACSLIPNARVSLLEWQALFTDK